MTRAHDLTALAAVLAAAPTLARADRREASLHVHAVGGVATLADPAARDRAAAPLAGLAARASYATHNHFQYDAALAAVVTGRAAFAAGTFTPAGRPPVVGPFTVASQQVRLDGGATLRLGVAWIPTVRVAAGLALRHHGAPAVDTGAAVVSDPAATGRRGALAADVTAAAALGLDHRVHRRLVVGGALGVVVSRPIWSSEVSATDAGPGSWRAFEATVHAAYYWYPR